MSKLIEIPIVGGVVDVDQIVAIRHHDGRDLGRGMFTVPRVIIDTRQTMGAFIIECDTHETMLGVLNTLTQAVGARRLPLAIPEIASSIASGSSKQTD